MKNYIFPKLITLALALILKSSLAISQAVQFTEVSHPFDGVRNGSVAFSDIDGDGDEDLLITGINPSDEIIAKLYNNDGLGNFTEVIGTPFDGVMRSSLAFADVDGDGDQDVLITGLNSNFNESAKLYKNDGLGNFSEVTGTPFTGVYRGSLAFSDIEGDGDLDVLITGETANNFISTNLYINDGAGNYSLGNYSFTGVYLSSVAFADVNGNGSEDLLITGLDANYNDVADLYRNSGTGNFVVETTFSGVRRGSVAFSDINGNGNLDLLITGYGVGNIAKLYANYGSYNFNEITGNTFSGVDQSSIAFSDIDQDGDQDVLITGLDETNIRIAKLYTNDGLGNFTEETGMSFPGVRLGAVAFSDIDGDGDQDLLITGEDSLSNEITKLYINGDDVSLKENKQNLLRLHPNPSSGLFILESELIDEDYSVVDSQGRLILSGVTKNQTTAINLKNEEVGIYYLKVSSAVLRLIKN